MNKKVLVIGDKCTDVFVYGKCKRLCPEAPVPIIEPKTEVKNPGMAGNVYENLKSLKVDSDLVCNVENIVKTRYIENCSNQMLLRVDSHDKCNRNTQKLDTAFLSQFAAVVIADYDKGFLTETDIKNISNRHPLTFLDTKKKIGQWAKNITYIKINKKEFDYTIDSLKNITNYEDKLILTLGEDGCVYDNVLYPVKKRIQTIDISGAGDTFMAGLVAKFLDSKDIKKSIEFAQECTSKIIQKKGVVTV
jgi:D-beta-D-heptose 7-phosphate kinase/D-beta-D-heptose 1-phosphate adenosyltransferase